MTDDLENKSEDCPLRMIEAETCWEYSRDIKKGDLRLNISEMIDKLALEQPVLVNFCLEHRPSYSPEEFGVFMYGVVFAYHHLRAQAIKDQTKEYE